MTSSPASKPRRNMWVGVLIGIIATLAMLALIAAAMFFSMGRCPMCGGMMTTAPSIPEARFRAAYNSESYDGHATVDTSTTRNQVCANHRDLLACASIFYAQTGDWNEYTNNQQR